MEKIGLVLEGGGMRGLYTCGVLEYFMENDLYFNYIIGVSAGACNAVSYISKQRGRNESVIINYAKDWRYMSLRNLLLSKSYFGMDFIFDEIPNKHVAFDFQTFYSSPCDFLVGATDCKTGKPIYLTKEDMGDKFQALRASASLPLISPIVNYKGYQLLDGGISDSIPIRKSIADGNTKNIVVLTRNKGYRKNPAKFTGLIKLVYRKYPFFVETMLNRYKIYNDTLDYIEQLEHDGQVLVIRPSKPLEVGRLEKDPQRLKGLLQNGYIDTKESYERILNFVS
ncbi:putative esterase of the alpha-beta hydrolase superfamily [Desulfosporosinus acidiphilus SJ4]|uniref:Putative esterase of the alpha-beta hydrolase superfamily n=1 Tax=Desulfosporosinus acidiphilus (strain DSM 22704 / JCM 16185 / SJ4) TaxID=646529 RepID=I4D5U5_DESAJ|nr:patatin family protein [Desulfosporosinus acidiphilus]AFM41169.1 putative esterase of the alpha-beta hydrolase superfamily [Desulfosporosinus acidiphilus SJ4]